MIIPSIDLRAGQAVQLIGGETPCLEAGDPVVIAEEFRLAGEIAVVDLDAALGEGDNREVIVKLCKVARCRVGGGIRDYDAARFYLDAGATGLVLGTAAEPELLSRLPKERVVVALDAKHGEVVVEGWRKGTGRDVIGRIKELKPYCNGFLVTFVEREGRMGGTDLERARAIVEAAAPLRVTIAGGVTTAEEIAELDAIGADAQVGMALYTGHMKLGDAIAAPLVSDRPDGLWPTVIADEHGVALGLAYSNAASLLEAVSSRTGVYHSRKRGLWRKGETSGATQELLAVDLDCDRDALRFTVRQSGAFCHLSTRSCWGEDIGIARLARRLNERMIDAPEGSYTARLINDPELLSSKILEEARELVDAQSPDDIAHETADVIYFALVKAVREGVRLEDIEKVLDLRERIVTRRPGDAKETLNE
ncbi:MAG: phosphoribosyl-ATP pyrophosphohydrolase/phosphoribosyl-AMP cyclohydrolase [Planctomycetota bacterium]|jgi:phosphoribosyl-ATP pyrophosphohydrolase/phosphoribosyl-AMP cyclohydrolase